MKQLKLRDIIIIGIFISMQIIFTRFLSIQTQYIRIGFQFLPIALCGNMFGWLVTGIAALVGDIIGCFFYGKGFHPGFSLSAFLTGSIYGYFLYKKSNSIKNIIIAVLLVCVGVELIMNTYWLTLLFGKSYFVLLPQRAIKTAIMIVVQILLISVCLKRILPIINNINKS